MSSNCKFSPVSSVCHYIIPRPFVRHYHSFQQNFCVTPLSKNIVFGLYWCKQSINTKLYKASLHSSYKKVECSKTNSFLNCSRSTTSHSCHVLPIGRIVLGSCILNSFYILSPPGGGHLLSYWYSTLVAFDPIHRIFSLFCNFFHRFPISWKYV